MSIRRIVGIGLALLSAAVLVFDVAKGLSGAGLLGFVSLGDLWARVNGASLNLVQAIVQRYLLPALWDPVLVTVLLLPAWPLLGVPPYCSFGRAARAGMSCSPAKRL